MQRRIAMAVAVAATTSFGMGFVAFAAVGGASVFGFNGPSGAVGPRSEMIVKHRTETIERVVVVAPVAPSVAGASRPLLLASLVDSGGHALAMSSPIASVQTVTSPNLGVQGAETTAPVVVQSSSSTQSTRAPVQPKFQSSTSPAGAQAPLNTSPTDDPITASDTTGPVLTATTAAPPNTASPVTNPSPRTTGAPDITAPPAPSAEPETTEAPATTALPAAPPAPETTAPPAPTVTSGVPEPATTTTVRPRGVPADWPANKPIPPMPPGCQEPQLEDNGIWNCDH